MSIDRRTAETADRLRWKLTAAAATPMDATGRVDSGVLHRYLQGLILDGAGGLAVCAHTGRGPYLDQATRHLVISTAARTGVPIVAGIGGTGAAADAVSDARGAAESGADALLVFPQLEDPVAYHDELWREAGLPLIAFDLYTSPYPLDVLRELLDHPGVLGAKLARMHDAVASQDALTAITDAGRLPITGEDRMFGPSLMWGARAALVGIAAAAVPVTARVFDAFVQGRHSAFVTASMQLDALAAVTFRQPYEGYVQRMLWIAAEEGLIPSRYAADLYRPEPDRAERDQVLDAWRKAR